MQFVRKPKNLFSLFTMNIHGNKITRKLHKKVVLFVIKNLNFIITSKKHLEKGYKSLT